MLTRQRKTLQWTAYSDAGDFRKENEDRLFANSTWIGRNRVGLFAVADGCGGMQDGAAASQLAMDAVRTFWDWELPSLLVARWLSDASVSRALEAMMRAAHGEVCQLARSQNSQAGSTLTVFLEINRRFWVQHVGDSRIYRLRDGHLEQLTEDQSLVADLLRNHEINEEQASGYPRSLLTMCLGYGRKLFPYQQIGKVKRGDVYCLCSDGLYAYAATGAIQGQLAQNPGHAQSLRMTIAAGEARDNVSFITVWEE